MFLRNYRDKAKVNFQHSWNDEVYKKKQQKKNNLHQQSTIQVPYKSNFGTINSWTHLNSPKQLFLFLHITHEMDGGVALYSKYYERHNKTSKLECEKSDNAACSSVLNKVRSYFTHYSVSIYCWQQQHNFPTVRRGNVVTEAEIISRFVQLHRSSIH